MSLCPLLLVLPPQDVAAAFAKVLRERTENQPPSIRAWERGAVNLSPPRTAVQQQQAQGPNGLGPAQQKQQQLAFGSASSRNLHASASHNGRSQGPGRGSIGHAAGRGSKGGHAQGPAQQGSGTAGTGQQAGAAGNGATVTASPERARSPKVLRLVDMVSVMFGDGSAPAPAASRLEPLAGYEEVALTCEEFVRMMQVLCEDR